MENNISTKKISNNINKDKIFSYKEGFKKDISCLLTLNECKNFKLILTIISSYFVNSENSAFLDNKNTFVKVLKQLFLNEKTIHTENINKHLQIYLAVLNKMYNSIDTNGQLYNGSVMDFLNIIAAYRLAGGFRKGDIVHGEGKRLGKNIKCLPNDKIKIYKSNFVFPPINYINPIIKKLDKILEDPDKDVYDKAASLGSYIFMAHPFEDGNSRSSRILMVSYLHRLGKIDVNLYTFITNFSKEFSNDTYYKFLQKNVYDRYLKFSNKIEFYSDGKIKRYLPLEEYLIILDEIKDLLKKRLIKANKLILKNRNYIALFEKKLYGYLNILNKEGLNSVNYRMYRYFLMYLFDNIEKHGIESLETIINRFVFSKNFIKKYNLLEEQIDSFYRKVRN